MRLALALLGGLYALATSGAQRRLHDGHNTWELDSPRATGRELISSRLALPLLESQPHLVPATGHLHQIKRPLHTFVDAGKLQALNSTSRSSESSSQYSISTSTTSCTETVDGVSVTSRVVVNGTRFGACYNNVTFQVNNFLAYFTSREENGLMVRGNEALVVVEFSGSNETSLSWALGRYASDGQEMDSLICFNLVDPSSAGSPTSNLFDGGWMCDVDGDGIYDLTDDIQIDCGCSAGVDAEEYYPCQEYEDLALNSSGELIIDGVSVDGCYEINTMVGTLGYYSYFAGPVEDGVATMFVATHSNATAGESAMFWSIGVFDGSGAYPACFLDAEVLNMTADTASRLSDGKWFCDLDADGTYEQYNGTSVEVQCACIDDSYTTCFENGEGISLDSGIVYDGDSIAGCYLPTMIVINDAQLFSLFWDPSIVGSIVMALVHHEDPALDFDDDVWAVTQIREYDEDTQISTFDLICLGLVADIELPTDPRLQGRWLCLDASGEYLTSDDSDFDEVACGCRGETSSSSTSAGILSSIPAPMPHFTSPPSNLLYPTSRPEVIAAPEHSLPSPTNLPAAGNVVYTNGTLEEQEQQYTAIGIIVGSSIAGVILIAGVVIIIWCGKTTSKRSVQDSYSSPAGGMSSGGHPGKTRQRTAISTSQGQIIPHVNHGRPGALNGNTNGNNGRCPPPSYLDMVNP